MHDLVNFFKLSTGDVFCCGYQSESFVKLPSIVFHFGMQMNIKKAAQLGLQMFKVNVLWVQKYRRAFINMQKNHNGQIKQHQLQVRNFRNVT